MKIQFESEIGTDLHLEISGIDGRVRCKLVGVLSNQFLIIEINEKLAHQMESSQSLPIVTIRGISRGHAFGFKTKCLRAIKEPHPLLFLDNPSMVQKQTIRKTRRVKCLLPAKFAVDTTGVSGVIADISNSGCHFQSNSDLNDNQKSNVQLNNQVMLSFQLPGKETPQNLEAVIRNIYVNNNRVHVGFEFSQPDTVTLKQLDEYIALSFDIEPF